jgi:hypothetical protein
MKMPLLNLVRPLSDIYSVIIRLWYLRHTTCDVLADARLIESFRIKSARMRARTHFVKCSLRLFKIFNIRST